MNEQALKKRLKSIAELEKRTFNEIWRKLALERFLVRISHSDHSEQFIFKGGLLLSHYLNIGRETKDADFLATQLNADASNIEKAFREICAVKVSDDFIFSYSNIVPLEQPHMNYPGFRVTLDLKFGEKMKDRIQVDIGVGDVVEPKRESLELYQYKGKPIFEGPFSLRVYPVETIFAEKLETVISKGAANSRMKDYHDLFLLCKEEGLLKISKLKKDISKTFQNRRTELILPIKFTKENYALMQKLWAGHRRGLEKVAENLKIPLNIEDLVSEINDWLIENKLKG
ncbi:MAG: nucleotidyl transferase AbiEii/AbiGii toxin family protein [Pseudomonadota bacterium]